MNKENFDDLRCDSLLCLVVMPKGFAANSRW